MIGTELDGRYRIEAQLGEGGVGTVYRALHVALGKPVAVKILRPELAASAALRQRFEREARALAALSHPNVVRILDSGVTGDVAYLVMDLLQGETLSDRLKRGAMPLREAASVLRQLLSALVYVHEQGLIHRDVKPANVFLEVAAPGQENVRLLDFGLAKFVAPEVEDRALTRAGQVFGTPSYMAPEQIAGQAADARADVYAVGIVFFAMLAGRTPFQGDESEILRKHVMEDLPMSALPSRSATPEIVALLEKATAKTRAQRYASAAEMLAALDAAIAALPALPSADDPTLEDRRSGSSHTDAPPGKLFRVGATVSVVVSLFGLVAAGIAIYVLVTPGREAERRKLESALSLPSARALPSGSVHRPVPSAVPATVASAAVPHAAAEPVPSAEPPAAAPPPSPTPPASELPPPRNPWTTIPPELGRFLTKVNHGRGLEKKELVQVHQYNGKHPDDPRGHLLLARSYTVRHWVKDAVSETEIALKIDPACRGDARMLIDLVKLVTLGSGEAGRIITEQFGRAGLSAVERALVSAPNPVAKAELERLAAELRAAPR